MRHGTQVSLEDGLPVEIRDRSGCVHASLTWEAGRLLAAMFPARPATQASSEVVAITGECVPHAVLGAAHRVLRSVSPDAPSTHVASCAAVDWARPGRIPAIDRPAELPAGVGTAIMNVLALLAARAGVTALRYVGPYPTMALWSTLGECFRARGGAEEFLDGAEVRALRAETAEVAVDFAPAPFERVVVAPNVWTQLRDGVERASIGDRSYARGAAVRRLVDGDGVAAQIWLAGEPWHEVARFDADGSLRAGPFPRPAVAAGGAFPPALVDALAELCAEGEPALLAPAMREALAATPIAWGDAGDSDAVREPGRGIVVHAILWERLAPRGMAALVPVLVEALTPLARRLGQALVAQRVEAP